MAYSAEEAALRAARNEAGRGGVLGKGGRADPNSFKVLQSTPLQDQVLSLIIFEGARPDLGIARSTCTFLYATRKQRLGNWVLTSGGGGCEGQIGPAEENDPQQPIGIQGSRTGGDGPNEIGFSTLSGQVYQEDIQAIRVSWADGTTQQVDVINASYIIARVGQVEMAQVEALDKQGNPVFVHRPETAPGKK